MLFFCFSVLSNYGIWYLFIIIIQNFSGNRNGVYSFETYVILNSKFKYIDMLSFNTRYPQYIINEY